MNQLDPSDAIAQYLSTVADTLGWTPSYRSREYCMAVTDNANPRLSQHLTGFLALACGQGEGA